MMKVWRESKRSSLSPSARSTASTTSPASPSVRKKEWREGRGKGGREGGREESHGRYVAVVARHGTVLLGPALARACDTGCRVTRCVAGCRLNAPASP